MIWVCYDGKRKAMEKHYVNSYFINIMFAYGQEMEQNQIKLLIICQNSVLFSSGTKTRSEKQSC